jgi:hypothetical protein
VTGVPDIVTERSRAFGPGSRVLLIGAAALAVAGALAGLVVYLTGPGSSSPAASYGQLPSWLPKAKVPVGRVVTASAAHPWHAIQGDTVSVRLGGGHVLATAVGPAVPEDGKFPVPETSPCTFVVTLTSASGLVPITRGAFTIIDEEGHLHHPHVSAADGGPVPARVAAGRTVTLRIHEVLPTGNGQLRWSPEGRTFVVSWDFDVEID